MQPNSLIIRITKALLVTCFALCMVYWSVLLGTFVISPPNLFELQVNASVLGDGMPWLLAEGESWLWLPSRFETVMSLLEVFVWVLMGSLLIACLMLFWQFKMRAKWLLCLALFASALLFISLPGVRDFQVISFWVHGALLLLLAGIYWRAHNQLIKIEQRSGSLIAYASQTGSAQKLAQQFAKTAGKSFDLRCVSTLTNRCLSNYDNMFFVVSTYGEGAAPDSAQGFINELNQLQKLDQQPKFSVLALGDRGYQQFCAFGHHLTDLLQARGAKPVLPTAEVDRMNIDTINHWWQGVGGVIGIDAKRVSTDYLQLEIAQTHCFNPHSNKRQVHHIRLLNKQLNYEPGDILAVRPQTSDGPAEERQYSIASAERGAVDLLVRRVVKDDGELGVASGFLTDQQVGARVFARVCPHPTFRLPERDVPLVLVGAGTGLAPYMGFLAKRQQLGYQSPIWLFFGEQRKSNDAYFAQALEDFQSSHVLTKLVCAWSRDDGVYVDSALHAHATDIQDLLANGAHVYLCGGKTGFGETSGAAIAAIADVAIAELAQQPWLHLDLY